jgi:hypothetical protein
MLLVEKVTTFHQQIELQMELIPLEMVLPVKDPVVPVS